MKSSPILIPALALYFIMMLTMPAHAYLDPGTGSMLLQLLLGGVVGLLTILKLYWHKIKSIFGKGDEPESQPESTTGEDS